MRNLKYLLLTVVAVPALAADPAALKQYQILNQSFYEFDPGAYKSFSCHVDVNTLDATLASIRPTAAAHPGLLKISDTLPVYTLTVDHASGVSITDPTLDIQLLDEKQAADPARLKRGISETQQGFTNQVQGVDQTLTGIFQNFLGKIPDLTSVTRDGSKWIVKYMEDGLQTTDTVDADHIHSVAMGNGVAVVADTTLTPVDGSKLAPQAVDVKTTQGQQTLTTHITMSYQKLGALQVPSVIVSQATVGIVGMAQTSATITVTLQSCSIKN